MAFHLGLGLTSDSSLDSLGSGCQSVFGNLQLRMGTQHDKMPYYRSLCFPNILGANRVNRHLMHVPWLNNYIVHVNSLFSFLTKYLIWLPQNEFKCKPTQATGM